MRSRKRVRLTAAVVGVLLACTLATPAQAHTVYSATYTYQSSFLCVYNYSGIDGANAGGHYEGRIRSKQVDFTTGTWCANDYTRPAGYIRQLLQTWRYDGTDWHVCAATSWISNPSSTNTIVADLGPDAHPPCGAGYYQLLHWGQIANGNWYPENAGPNASGEHWLQ